MDRWRGKVAVITGASAGIGAHVVELLVKADLKVVGLARRIDLLQQMASRMAKYHPGSFCPIECDLREEKDILQAFAIVEEKIGPIHILINNAGYLIAEKIIEGRTEEFRKILDLNVLAPAICIREATKLMLKHKVRGHIINLNSVGGHDAHRIKMSMSLYCASKYAITGMTETVRNELSAINAGIKTTSISPGPVRTSMIRAAGVVDEMLDKYPILEAKDVAEAVIYALSTPAHVQVNELMLTPVDDAVQQINNG